LSTLLAAGGGGHQSVPRNLMKGVHALSSAPTGRPNNDSCGGFFSRTLEPVSPRLQLHIVDETDSTQDEARRMLHEIFNEERPAEAEGSGSGGSGTDDASTSQSCRNLGGSTPGSGTAYAVMAKRQTSGRGTQGRTWEAGAGNLFLTVCLPMDAVPVRITLLPLQVAVLVAKLVHNVVAQHSPNSVKTASKRTTVKWPNDVLVDQRKISGTLIENVIVSSNKRSGGDAWLLIGVGINVESAPTLDSSSPGKHGRQSISLRDALPTDAELPSAIELGTALASQMVDWAFLVEEGVDEGDEDSANRRHKRAMREAKVIEDWREFAAWGTRYELRGRTVEEEIVAGFRGETVTTLDIEPDGQLLVVDSNGSERRLVADYLF
jgi:biotin-(acetyl-CoA carboxylase) ligase